MARTVKVITTATIIVPDDFTGDEVDAAMAIDAAFTEYNGLTPLHIRWDDDKIFNFEQEG